MKSFALISLFVVSAFAGEILHETLVEPLPSFTQEQNTATGEYGYSYSGGPNAKTEFRAADGTTTGTYSYVDAHGILQTVNYIADEFGFRAAGSNIPVDGVSPLDAPDVAVAKAAHLAEHSRQTLNALSHRRKRGIFGEPILAAAPAVAVRTAIPAIATTSYTSSLPLATSHQSRFQIHNGAKIIEQTSYPVHAPLIATAHAAPILATSAHAPALLFRKKRGIFAAEAPLAVAAAPLPPTTAKILDEFAQKPALVHAAPVAYAAPSHLAYAAPAIHAAPAAVAVRTAVPALATTSYTSTLPLATSHQSRFQIHNGAKIIEQTSYPVAAPIAAAAFPAAHHIAAAPAFASEALIADSDAIAVESA